MRADNLLSVVPLLIRGMQAARSTQSVFLLYSIICILAFYLEAACFFFSSSPHIFLEDLQMVSPSLSFIREQGSVSLTDRTAARTPKYWGSFAECL